MQFSINMLPPSKNPKVENAGREDSPEVAEASEVCFSYPSRSLNLIAIPDTVFFF